MCQMATKLEIQNAILESMGNPDSGTIRDNIDAIVDAVLSVVNPETKTNFTNNKDTRVIEADETR